MKVLITGAFGNLGLMCVKQALAEGLQVRCFDLDSPANRKTAEAFGGRTEVVFGDIREGQTLEALVDGVDAVIHNASVLPPVTEDSPEFARTINVTACLDLIRAAEATVQKPVFVFPSSVTVFGLPPGPPAVRAAGDPVEATDNYTRHKLAIEQALQQSSLPWVILRIGVSVDARTLATDKNTFRQLLDVQADNPLEYVHPRDVALAMCRAVTKPEAQRKVLLIGGGAPCQISQRAFLTTAFTALGLHLPLSAHGNSRFYTHWMDTAESQQILQYQQHDFTDYQREMAARLAPLKWILWPIRWLINPLLPLLLRIALK